MGGSFLWRGGVFEVIQSHSDSLYRRVLEGNSSWSKESPGGGAFEKLFWVETPLKISQQIEGTTPVTTPVIIQLNDCATSQPTNADRLSNASQLASLKTDGIKVLIASLPANYPSASIVLP